MKRILFILSYLLMTVTGCSHKQAYHSIEITDLKAQHATPPPITIFIHGTCPGFLPKKLLRTAFHCGDGFHRAEEVRSSGVTWNFIKTIADADPEHFPLETFYAFCWSGALDFQAREYAAKKLYSHIKRLITSYEKKYGTCPPLIRVIGHSHGCNVALNLARIKSEKSFIINQLILLAGPVQQATAHLAHDDMFKRIYSLYSSADSLQVLDPQGTYKEAKKITHETHDHVPLFSQRRFAPAPHIRQVKIKFFGRAPLHIEFIRPHFAKYLPQILNEMDDWRDLGVGKKGTYILKIER